MKQLRRHQAETLAIAQDIARGYTVKRIYVSVTPGGGKSALPGILADTLIPRCADHILWVVPRNSLRDQGESDFPQWSRFRIRAASNEADPCRGTSGYVTTYQAIVQNPGRHADNLKSGRWIVFLDEPHHLQAGGRWEWAMAPVINRASLLVLASGTFARGDGQPISCVDYDTRGLPLLGKDNPAAELVRYTRTDALREGAIVPVYFRHLDGRAEWEDEEGQVQSVDTLATSDYAPQALFTALRTEYAYELLDECVAAWREHRKDVFPNCKLLVVAPNIELAQLYQHHLHKRHIEALIATSDDTPAAGRAIAQFKGQQLPTADALVSVGMAYEGLSVPAITHVACLTHIRSIPWLEQCFARANRTCPGKIAGFVYGPNDNRFREAIQTIENEQVLALMSSDSEDSEGGFGDSEDPESSGPRKWITPIGSAAYRDDEGLFDFSIPAAADGGMTPKAAEKLLRSQIARHIEVFLDQKRSGSKQAYSRIIHQTLKGLVGGKSRDDCTVEELTRQWALLKELWPV